MPILHLGEYLFRQNPSTSAILVSFPDPPKKFSLCFSSIALGFVISTHNLQWSIAGEGVRLRLRKQSELNPSP